MADIRATQSGDFSATSTWVGGVVPGSGDVAYANTFTVTISDTRTVQAISNASGTSITVGGTFSLLNGCNLTCTNANGVVQGATATSCITTPSLGVGSSASVAANSAHTATGNGPGFTFSTTGSLNWTGNLVGSTASGVAAYLVSGAGTFNLTGSLTGGTINTGATTLSITGTATVSIVGNVIGSIAPGLSITSGTVTVTGNVTGGSSSAGIINNGSTTLTVNGTCQSSTTQPAIAAGSATQITRLSGPFLLGASGNINPVQAQSWRWAPTQIPTYMEVPTSGGSTKRNLFTSDNIPTTNYPATSAVRSGTVYGPNNENTGTLAVPAASSVALGVAVDNTSGTAVLTAANVRTAVGMASANLDSQLAGISAPSAATVATAVWSNATRTLTTTIPTAADVASAVWSAATRTITSTIPAAADVASAVWSAVARTITGGTVDTLTNAPSVPSAAAIASQVRTELTTELARLDVATSTRLAAASYTAPTTPPTAAAIRTEMDANSTKLANLDATVSSRLSAASYSAAPTTAAIRTELAVELARLDVAVSSRLAPAGTLATVTTLTNAPSVPSAAAIASQVRTELTPELARVANCSTVDTTATAIQDAVGA